MHIDNVQKDITVLINLSFIRAHAGLSLVLTIMKMKYLNGFNDNVLDSWLFVVEKKLLFLI